MSSRAPRSGPDDLDALIEKVDCENLRVIVGKAAERHEDIARAVRLAASRSSGDLSPIRQGAFAAPLAALREIHRRRPTFIAALDKARLG